MKRIPSKYLTKRVAVNWIDPTGFINSDLKDVDVSECVSDSSCEPPSIKILTSGIIQQFQWGALKR